MLKVGIKKRKAATMRQVDPISTIVNVPTSLVSAQAFRIVVRRASSQGAHRVRIVSAISFSCSLVLQ